MLSAYTVYCSCVQSRIRQCAGCIVTAYRSYCSCVQSRIQQCAGCIATAVQVVLRAPCSLCHSSGILSAVLWLLSGGRGSCRGRCTAQVVPAISGYFVQFSIFSPLMRPRCSPLFVTRTALFTSALAPIKMSESSMMRPVRRRSA